MFAHGETITRLRATAEVDPYSDEPEYTDWDTPDTLAIPGWGVADQATGEPIQDARNSVVSDFTLFRDEPADVTSKDRVVVRGLTCEVVGRPFEWIHPMTGWRAGFVVKASIVEG